MTNLLIATKRVEPTWSDFIVPGIRLNAFATLTDAPAPADFVEDVFHTWTLKGWASGEQAVRGYLDEALCDHVTDVPVCETKVKLDKSYKLRVEKRVHEYNRLLDNVARLNPG